MPWDIQKIITLLTVTVLFLFTFFNLILDAPHIVHVYNVHAASIMHFCSNLARFLVRESSHSTVSDQRVSIYRLTPLFLYSLLHMAACNLCPSRQYFSETNKSIGRKLNWHLRENVQYNCDFYHIFLAWCNLQGERGGNVLMFILCAQ